MSLAAGSERVVSVGPGKEATSWNSNNGQKEKAYEAGGTATAAAISKDLQRIAVGGSDGTIKLYTVADAKLIGSISAGAQVAELIWITLSPQITVGSDREFVYTFGVGVLFGF